MSELWDQLTQQPVAEPPSLWPQGDRAPLRITVGGPTMKDGAQSSGSSLDPFNPPQVQYIGRPLGDKAAHMKISVGELEKRLRAGDAQLLSGIIATPVGAAIYAHMQKAQQQPDGGL
jgi:hypothetical protein